MQRIVALFEQAAAEGVLSAAACAVVSGEHLRFATFGGFTDTQGQNRVVQATSVFDCASVTKSIPTGVLALQALEGGLWSLDDAVVRWLPELSMRGAEAIQVRHLLTHTLDYRIALSSLKELPPAQILDRLFMHEFEHPPGQSYLYCNATSILLGLALERLLGGDLPSLAQSNVFDTLGLSRTGFFPLEWAQIDEIVASEQCPWRGRDIRGVPHDESAWALRPKVVGSAGLFSCVADLGRVLQSLLGHGPQLMSSQTRAWLGQDWTGDLPVQATLGFELRNSRWMDESLPCPIGKTGFTGATILFDPELDGGLAFLCNWTWPRRKSSTDAIFAFRKRLTALLPDVI